MKNEAVAANTDDCFRAFVGQLMRWYFRKDGDSYLIFEDGRALVFHHETGAYWVVSANDVGRELAIVSRQLQAKTDALSNVLALAGAQSSSATVLPSVPPRQEQE